MLSRIAGRLLTGPLAFLVAGVLDVLAYAWGSLRRRWGPLRRRSARRRGPGA